jgi:hypothetical protein
VSLSVLSKLSNKLSDVAGPPGDTDPDAHPLNSGTDYEIDRRLVCSVRIREAAVSKAMARGANLLSAGH